MRRAIGWFFEDWDFLMTPAVSVAAFPAEKPAAGALAAASVGLGELGGVLLPVQMSGNPAASVPCGFTADGLPVGLQIVGRRFDDLGVLQAAAAFEAAGPWAWKRPLSS